MPELIIQSKEKQFVCLYDEDDHELIMNHSWSLHSAGYAMTTINGKTVLMHRLVMRVLDKPLVNVDHRFHNRLDNRKSQLRACTRSENRRNARKLKPTAHSQFKGIYNDLGRWHAQIMQDSKVKNLGRYHDEVTAAKVYDRKALEVFKDYAYINFESSREARQLTFSWI